MESKDIATVTGIATAFATLASLAVSLLWRRIDRREADWIVFDVNTKWTAADSYSGEPTPPHASMELANVGDVAAYQLRAVGVGCVAWLYGPWTSSGRRGFEVVPAFEPGTDVHLVVHCDPSVWADAFVVITWIASPTRRRWRSRRAYVLRLESIAEPPQYYGPLALDAKTGREERGLTDPPPDWQMPDRLAPQQPLPRGAAPKWWARWRTKQQLRQRARRGQ